MIASFHARFPLVPLSILLAQGCTPDPVAQTDGSTTEASTTAVSPTATGITTDVVDSTAADTTSSETTSVASSSTSTGDTTSGDSSTSTSDTTSSSGSASTSDTTGDTETSETGTETGTEPLPPCPGVGVGATAVGDACTANADCASALCTIYTDAPLNLDAVCAVPPLDCSLRLTGTSLDVVSLQPIAGADLRLASALQAATNPIGAMGLIVTTSGADGRLDGVTAGPPMAPIGLMALLEAPGFHLTASPAVEALEGTGDYGVATEVHDLWLVPSDAVADWSAMLALDPSIPAQDLPLGAHGGVVGLVRDAAGVPLAGATVSSLDPGSGSIVRYLNDDGTFGTMATGAQGIVVILDPSLAEQFQAELGGVPIGAATVISANDAVFVATFTAP